MPQAGKPTPVAAVSSHPIFPVKKQSDDGAGNDAEQHAGPPSGEHGFNDKRLLHGLG